MAVGVHGLLETVERQELPVKGETKSEQEHAQTLGQLMVERTVKDLSRKLWFATLMTVQVQAVNCSLTLPVDGGWGSWSEWTPHGREQKRVRSCSNPAPRNGGNKCEGPKEEKATCTVPGCPGNDE